MREILSEIQFYHLWIKLFALCYVYFYVILLCYTFLKKWTSSTGCLAILVVILDTFCRYLSLLANDSQAMDHMFLGNGATGVGSLPLLSSLITCLKYLREYQISLIFYCRARGPVQRSHPSQSHNSKNISPFRGNGPGVDIKITPPHLPHRKTFEGRNGY